jgi:hypothetical protein
MEFIIKMAFKADKKKEAEDEAKDMMRIRNAMSREDHKQLAELLEKDPDIIKRAKRFLWSD